MEMVADLFSFDILASAAPGAAAAGDRSAMETVQIFFDTIYNNIFWITLKTTIPSAHSAMEAVDSDDDNNDSA